MIKERLEELRAMELEAQGLATRQNMLALAMENKREEILGLLTEETDGDYPLFSRVSSCPLDNVVAVVSIGEDYYEFPVGHPGRMKVEFIPIMPGQGVSHE
jgi:hypothetical protein